MSQNEIWVLGGSSGTKIQPARRGSRKTNGQQDVFTHRQRLQQSKHRRTLFEGAVHEAVHDAVQNAVHVAAGHAHSGVAHIKRRREDAGQTPVEPD
jgi:hypothetical protein